MALCQADRAARRRRRQRDRGARPFGGGAPPRRGCALPHRMRHRLGAERRADARKTALELAQLAMNLPRMHFEGLMTFPNTFPRTAEFFDRALKLFAGEGIPVPVVSGGGSPALKTLDDFPDDDRAPRRHLRLQRRDDGALPASRPGTTAPCRSALTVVSRPTPDRAIARCRLEGAHARTSIIVKDYGRVVEYPEARIVGAVGGARHGRPFGLQGAAAGRRGRQRHPQPLLRRLQHGRRGLRHPRRVGGGRLAGRGARQGAVAGFQSLTTSPLLTDLSAAMTILRLFTASSMWSPRSMSSSIAFSR